MEMAHAESVSLWSNSGAERRSPVRGRERRRILPGFDAGMRAVDATLIPAYRE